jgi:hypothetical protein
LERTKVLLTQTTVLTSPSFALAVRTVEVGIVAAFDSTRAIVPITAKRSTKIVSDNFLFAKIRAIILGFGFLGL